MTTPSPNPNPDLLLARRAAAGHEDAWEEIVDRLGQRIYNLALQFSPTPQEAEDLTQEIFLKLHRNLKSYRGDVPFTAWVLRLSRNQSIDHYRRARRERASTHVSSEVLEWIPADGDPDSHARRRHHVAAVHQALGDMDDEVALTVVMKDLQGFSLDEVAAYFETPVGTVKSRLHRARKWLAEHLPAYLDPTPAAHRSAP
jgi:RNA polymerase sigma-70 factor, ECF subfamily